jgi:hypothetical protein
MNCYQQSITRRCAQGQKGRGNATSVVNASGFSVKPLAFPLLQDNPPDLTEKIFLRY